MIYIRSSVMDATREYEKPGFITSSERDILKIVGPAQTITSGGQSSIG